MGGLLAYATLRVTAALKRAAVVYSLMAFGALIAIFAMGYALNAGYTALMFRYGAIAASLAIAGGLFGVAAACALSAYLVGRRPRPTSLRRSASSYAHLHLASEPIRQRAIALGAGIAATLAAVVVGILVRRSSNSD